MDKNKCANLEIQDLYSDINLEADSLEDIFAAQQLAQENVYGTDFEKLRESLGELRKYIDWNYHADMDEWREFFEALGGVDTHGSAIWKPWKKAHSEACNKPFSELTESEMLELRFELVDRLCFFINVALAIGMDAKMLYNMYFAKMNENINRQRRGY